MKLFIQIQREHPDKPTDVVQLNGTSAICSVMSVEPAEDIRHSEMPVVSLRCDTAAEIAWHLAAIMATVKHVNADAYAAAFDLMPLVNVGVPIFRRMLDE